MVHVRKLVKAGQASHTISLPKDWLEKNNLKSGDNLYINEKSDTELIISLGQSAASLPKKEITLVLDGKDLETAQREIASAYVNNFHSIHIMGKNIEENLPAIRNIIQSFVALEITEQTPKSIIIKDFLDIKEVDIEKTLRRMDMMVRTMLKECADESLAEDMRTKDEEVNKLYFLLNRHLKAALTTPAEAERLNLSHDKVISNWYLVVNLENLADYAKNLHTFIGGMTKEQAKLARDTLSAVANDFESAMTAFYKKDKQAANTILRNRLSIVEKCNSFGAKHRNTEVGEFVERCKAMTTLVANIGKTIIDDQ